MADRLKEVLDGATKRAEWYAEAPERAADLIGRATAKADAQKGRLDKVWDELAALFRLLRAWMSGKYRAVATKSIVLVIAALLYFVNPMDVIPDFVPAIGLVDDLTVLGFVINSLRKEIDQFVAWEQSNG